MAAGGKGRKSTLFYPNTLPSHCVGLKVTWNLIRELLKAREGKSSDNKKGEKRGALREREGGGGGNATRFARNEGEES